MGGCSRSGGACTRCAGATSRARPLYGCCSRVWSASGAQPHQRGDPLGHSQAAPAPHRGDRDRNASAPRGHQVHRRKTIDAARHKGIPLTSPTQTLLDLALRLNGEQYERAVNEAANLDLIDPEELRATLDTLPSQPGIRPLRTLLDRDTYTLTHTELEQRVAPIARRAGLARPDTQVYVNGRRADFLFQDAGIALEADSLRFHRTPAQQAKDTRREHAYAKAGLLPLRFTHHQITFDPKYVEETLRGVVDSRPSRSSIERPNSRPTRRAP